MASQADPILRLTVYCIHGRHTPPQLSREACQCWFATVHRYSFYIHTSLCVTRSHLHWRCATVSPMAPPPYHSYCLSPLFSTCWLPTILATNICTRWLMSSTLNVHTYSKFYHLHGNDLGNNHCGLVSMETIEVSMPTVSTKIWTNQISAGFGCYGPSLCKSCDDLYESNNDNKSSLLLLPLLFPCEASGPRYDNSSIGSPILSGNNCKTKERTLSIKYFNRLCKVVKTFYLTAWSLFVFVFFWGHSIKTQHLQLRTKGVLHSTQKQQVEKLVNFHIKTNFKVTPRSN